MKKLIFLLLLLIPLSGFSQSKFAGFFKPVSNNLFPLEYSMQPGLKIPGVWLFRPAIELSAVKLTWNGTTKQFDASALDQVGIGIGYQHFIDNSGTPYNNFGINGLLLFGADKGSGSVAFALTGSFLQYVNIGAMVNIAGVNAGTFGLLTGVTLKF